MGREARRARTGSGSGMGSSLKTLVILKGGGWLERGIVRLCRVKMVGRGGREVRGEVKSRCRIRRGLDARVSLKRMRMANGCSSSSDKWSVANAYDVISNGFHLEC